MNAVHYSSNKDEWETPPEIFDLLDEEFNFDLDPCGTLENSKCEDYYDIEANGLERCWEVSFRCAFVNPPYSKLKNWIAKCAEQAEQGMTCVMLISSRTDTKAWHTYIYDPTKWKFRPGVEVRFIPGRITFWENGKPAVSKKTGKKQPAPFPSCIVIFRPT